MRVLLAIGMVLAMVMPTRAQDCTPQQTRLMAQGDGMRGIIPNPDTDEVSNLVPPGYVNIYFDASIGYFTPDETPPTPIEVTLIKQIHWGPKSWWEQGIAQSVRRSTPLLAWSGSILVQAGERLAARFVPMPGQYYVMYTGVYFPEACLARYLGLEAPGTVSGSVGTVTFPKFTVSLQGTAVPQP